MKTLTPTTRRKRPRRPKRPTPTLTAPARLNLLLEWLKGDFDEHYFEGRNPEPVAVRTDFPAIRRALADFVKSFDGSAEAAHVVAEPDDTVEAIDDEAIGDLEARLNFLLGQGFGENPFDAEMAFPAASLRFAVGNARRKKPKVSKFDVTENGSPLRKGLGKALRNYQAPGAYVLRVQGPTFDLVPFLAAHLLTAPNMTSVKRCERQGCAHFVITAATPGRPQRFCNAACREWNRELEQQRKTKGGK